MSRELCRVHPSVCRPGCHLQKPKVTQRTCCSQRGCQCVNSSPLRGAGRDKNAEEVGLKCHLKASRGLVTLQRRDTGQGPRDRSTNSVVGGGLWLIKFHSPRAKGAQALSTRRGGVLWGW